MTCIAAIGNGKKVWIGGDSAGTNQMLDTTTYSDPKVFVRGEFAFGFAGSFKVIQAMKFFNAPEHTPDLTDNEYMISTFVDTMQEFLERKAPGEFGHSAAIVGYHGKVYVIHGNFQVLQPNSNFCAVGSGGVVAEGSLRSSKGSPHKRVLLALEASADLNAGVAGPFHVVTV